MCWVYVSQSAWRTARCLARYDGVERDSRRADHCDWAGRSGVPYTAIERWPAEGGDGSGGFSAHDEWKGDVDVEILGLRNDGKGDICDLEV